MVRQYKNVSHNRDSAMVMINMLTGIIVKNKSLYKTDVWED